MIILELPPTTRTHQLPISPFPADPETKAFARFIDLMPVHPVTRPLQDFREIVVRHLDSLAKMPDRRNARQFTASTDSCGEPAFQQLKKALGETTYQELIKEAMKPADMREVPETYRLIWKLGVRGVITTNIDRMAAHAYASLQGVAATEFSGGQLAQFSNILQRPGPFIANMHGQVENFRSWVFTRSELQHLLGQASYRDFIRTCLMSHRFIFIGITLDDIAVGGHLERLKTDQIDMGAHYWVTSRTDSQIDHWAESIGVRIIRYTARESDHSELNEALTNLAIYISPEDPPISTPVTSQHADSDTIALPALHELTTLEPEIIRNILNAYVRTIDTSTAQGRDRFKAFKSTYDQAIYNAWYVTNNSGSNVLLGYTIEERIGKGAFGTVYRARGQAGEELAVKVLLEEIRNNEDLLQSFRRGVRSMRLLAEAKAEGVVGYRDSSEIPAFVVMDWIDGPSLQEAVDAKQIQDWHTILRICHDLARIIRSAHDLPQRVLHRDLRPSNVMLRDFYTDPTDWQVVVLDFDLSWHKGAAERSVTHGSTVFGYLAPEQITKTAGVSTRSSAVDSFGLGMLFYFICSGRHPLPAEQRHRTWPSTVQDAMQDCHDWHSMPKRFARLIRSSTEDVQSRRWDVAQIENELARLMIAVFTPEEISDPDMIAEELAARCDSLRNYDWSEKDLSASLSMATGVTISVRGNPTKDTIEVLISWSNTGVQSHKNVTKWIEQATPNCQSALTKAGWTTDKNIDYQSMFIRANIPAAIVATDFLSHARALDRAASKLKSF